MLRSHKCRIDWRYVVCNFKRREDIINRNSSKRALNDSRSFVDLLMYEVMKEKNTSLADLGSNVLAYL